MITEEQKKALERERDDWKAIFEAFMVSEENGLALFAGKEGRCGLCPSYRHTVTEGSSAYFSCRECPIVVLKGNTCYHIWKVFAKCKPGDEHILPYEGMRIAWITYKYLDELIGGL